MKDSSLTFPIIYSFLVWRPHNQSVHPPTQPSIVWHPTTFTTYGLINITIQANQTNTSLFFYYYFFIYLFINSNPSLLSLLLTTCTGNFIPLHQWRSAVAWRELWIFLQCTNCLAFVWVCNFFKKYLKYLILKNFIFWNYICMV
jgi:hypothetical protein